MVCLLLTGMLLSCRTGKIVRERHVTADTLRHTSAVADSSRRDIQQQTRLRDTLFVRDTVRVSVRQRGDTVFQTERIVSHHYHITHQVDTIREQVERIRLASENDSIVRTDTLSRAESSRAGGMRWWHWLFLSLFLALLIYIHLRYSKPRK